MGNISTCGLPVSKRNINTKDEASYPEYKKMMGEASRPEIERTRRQRKEQYSNEERRFQNLRATDQAMSKSEHQHDNEDELSLKQVQLDQSATKEDNMGEKWHHDLTKSLNEHRNLLGGLDDALKAHMDTIDRLLQYTAESPVNNVQPDDSTKTEGAKPTLVERPVDILENIKKSYESISKPLKDSFETLHLDIDKSREQFGKSRIAIRQLKENESKQKREINELQKQIRNLKSELEHYRPRNGPATTRTIQLFYLHEVKAIKDIEKELKSMLTNKLRNTHFRTCKWASDIDPNKLVIVLYIVASRVGADAANAIKDIKNPGNTILMLIHYKDVHSFSSERSSDVLNDKKFRNLLGILDLAFMTDNGLFHCEMNESSIDALCGLCRERSGGDRL